MDPTAIAIITIGTSAALFLVLSTRKTRRLAARWRTPTLYDFAQMSDGSVGASCVDGSAGGYSSADGGSCGADGGSGGHC